MKAASLMTCGLVSAFFGCTFDSSQLRALSPDGAAGYGGASAGTGGQAGIGDQTATATSTAPSTCVPGASVACACPTGQQGAQTCTSAGTFAACACAAPTVDAGSAGGADGAVTRSPDTPASTSTGTGNQTNTASQSYTTGATGTTTNTASQSYTTGTTGTTTSMASKSVTTTNTATTTASSSYKQTATTTASSSYKQTGTTTASQSYTTGNTATNTNTASRSYTTTNTAAVTGSQSYTTTSTQTASRPISNPQPVDLLLVLDRSSSMSNDITTDSACNTGSGAAACTTKWSTMTASLTQVFAASPAGVQWGLKFFTSPKGSTCTVNPGADVAVGPNTATQIQTAIAGTSPANQTPTTAAIQAAVAYYGTVNDGLAHYIILATDGQPNCDPGTSSSVTDASVQDAAAAIAAGAVAGIKTYVIGIGPSVGSLTSFAQAGGTGTYFSATSPDALTAALTSIVGAVAP